MGNSLPIPFRAIFPLLLLSIWLCPLHANSRAERAVSTYLKEIKSAQEKVDKAFKSEIKVAMKNNDLDQANLIKKQWDEWKKKNHSSSSKEKKSEPVRKEVESKEPPAFKKLNAMELLMANNRWTPEESTKTWGSSATFSKDRKAYVKLGWNEKYESDGSFRQNYLWRITLSRKLELVQKNEFSGKYDLHMRFGYNPGSRTWLPEYSKNKRKFKLKMVR